MSLIGVLVLGVPTVNMFLRGAEVTGTLFGALVLGIVSFTVRGYEITPDTLLVRRLFWTTRWPLQRPTTARTQPRAMAGSWRLWGNGGFFAFSGHFSNSRLGRYRAFVTDMTRTVVLTTPRGLVVVSPDDPEEFVRAVDHVTQAVS